MCIRDRNSTADGAIRVTILDSYIRPQMWLTRRVTLSGLPTSGASVRFYQNIDTYLLGGDNGPGFTRTSPWNTTGRSDIVGVVKGDPVSYTHLDVYKRQVRCRAI